MAVVYSLTLRTNRLSLVLSAIDGGVTNGWLRLLDIFGNVLSSLQLARPCGVITSGVLVFSGMSLVDPAAAATGSAVGARVEDGSGNVIISGLTVGGTGSGDIAMAPSNFITAGQSVAITSATITGN